MREAFGRLVGRRACQAPRQANQCVSPSSVPFALSLASLPHPRDRAPFLKVPPRVVAEAGLLGPDGLPRLFELAEEGFYNNMFPNAANRVNADDPSLPMRNQAACRAGETLAPPPLFLLPAPRPVL